MMLSWRGFKIHANLANNRVRIYNISRLKIIRAVCNWIFSDLGYTYLITVNDEEFLLKPSFMGHLTKAIDKYGNELFELNGKFETKITSRNYIFSISRLNIEYKKIEFDVDILEEQSGSVQIEREYGLPQLKITFSENYPNQKIVLIAIAIALHCF